MMPKLESYDIDVLREINGEKVPGLCWGAAMSVAIETLESAGLAELRGTKYVVTDAGKKFLARQRLRVVGGD